MHDEGLTEDLAALKLALDLTLADDPPDPGRVEQVQSMLKQDDWREVTEFAVYHQQMSRLKLHPAMSPPCWLTADEADAILARGPQAAYDGSGVDISNCQSARLFKRMMSLGISKFHPDPIAAIAEARKSAARENIRTRRYGLS